MPTNFQRTIAPLLVYTITNGLPGGTDAPTDIQGTIARILDYTIPTELTAETHIPHRNSEHDC